MPRFWLLIFSLAHDNPPLPTFNLSRLLASIPAAPKLTPGSVISVEAFVISGSSSTAVKNDPHIFYESEIIAIVYRGKSKPSGLVATTVWAWVGAKATMEDKEEAKLQEMANRFNTSLVWLKLFTGSPIDPP
jgi:methionine aminopeptidase